MSGGNFNGMVMHKAQQKEFVEPGDRAPRLLAERNRKMAASAHAYVRGSTVRFYQWLEDSNRAALPEGPSAWICGDCHVGNLGPLAGTDGGLAVQIRDLDQTVIGNPVHDLIRLDERSEILPRMPSRHIRMAKQRRPRRPQ